ncbi:hypothetical protein C0431_00555 [bacterium]|jgi:hypothetical protein|nr:hypothetical protein [bacterium]
MKWIVALVVVVGLIGCAQSEPAGDYKPAEEGSYKTSESVPGREGRTKAEAAPVQTESGLTEGG